MFFTAFKKVMPELSNFQAALVQLAFYGGYGTMAIPAAFITGILIGLLLYAIGAILFWPAAVYEQFTFFLMSLYNLDLLFLKQQKSIHSISWERQRLDLSQAFNPIGSLMKKLIIIENLRSDE